MKLANRIDALASALPDSDPRKAEFRSRAATLGQDCACAMGGIFLLAAIFLTILYFATMEPPSMATGAFAIGFVLAASLLGKLVGIGWVRFRLVMLRRDVIRRTARKEGAHVYLH